VAALVVAVDMVVMHLDQAMAVAMVAARPMSRPSKSSTKRVVLLLEVMVVVLQQVVVMLLDKAMAVVMVVPLKLKLLK